MRLRDSFSIVCAVLLAYPGLSWAASGVRDEAGFFKPAAIAKADEIISAIKRNAKKDFRVETFLHVPSGKEKEAADPDSKDDFFKEWADERGREQKINGVYVLICKNPTYLRVVTNNRTAKVFNEEARNRLSKMLLTSFQDKDYDQGLLDGARYVQTALKGKGEIEATEPKEQTDEATMPQWPTRSETGPRPTQRRTNTPGTGVSLPWIGLGGLLCVGLVILLAIGVVIMVVSAVSRAFHRGPAGYGPSGYGPVPPGGGYGGYGGGYGGGGQGGGFMSSMLGGMFGGAAGSWGYDRFFGGHQASSGGGMPRQEGPSTSPSDEGYTGGGGDFGGAGDTGGGGDFGGGDGGGGDFGGGDDAGGGGDFGGGGGGGDDGGGGSF